MDELEIFCGRVIKTALINEDGIDLGSPRNSATSQRHKLVWTRSSFVEQVPRTGLQRNRPETADHHLRCPFSWSNDAFKRGWSQGGGGHEGCCLITLRIPIEVLSMIGMRQMIDDDTSRSHSHKPSQRLLAREARPFFQPGWKATLTAIGFRIRQSNSIEWPELLLQERHGGRDGIR